MAAAYKDPSEYIQHHLAFLSKPVGDGGFWAINVDSVATAFLLGVVSLGFLWWVVRGATSGVPNRRQAFVEVLIAMIDDQVKGVFHHGDRNRFVAPLALTVFVWVVLMNAMDFVPADWVVLITHPFAPHGFRAVPTADVNTTFALALSVWLLMLGFAVRVKGLGGFTKELFCAPFGTNPFLWPANFLFNCVEYISKPLSHSLRLFGNMYAGEILFLLLWMWAASSSWETDYFLGVPAAIVLGLFWIGFHVLIVLLQAYIFMMLTVVYISMAHEHH